MGWDFPSVFVSERGSDADTVFPLSIASKGETVQRRTWIHHVLPFVFAALPLAAGALIFAAIPPAARVDYLTRLEDSHIDWLILALGALLFTAQTLLAWQALKLRDDDGRPVPATDRSPFNETPDKWLSQLAQAAEWFPLLGLIGTVAAILQTFSSFSPDKPPSYSEIIQKYGPAITATGSGLFMALMNILPSWMVRMGRDVITTLAGPGTPPPPPPTYRPAESQDYVPLSQAPAVSASIGKPEGRA